MVSFNPRARRGRDIAISSLIPKSQFQSTRPQGARLYSYNIRHFMVLTTPERETLVMPKNILRNPDSKTYNGNNSKRI